MPRNIAFLRAINAGNGRTVKMVTLRQLFESLGLAQVETFIASGNVIFETRGRNQRKLEERIENRVSQALGYPVLAFLRTEAELAEIARYEPFPLISDASADVNVIFLAAPLDATLEERVIALRTEADEFQVHGREIYWLRLRGPDGTILPAPPLEKTLGQPFTIRSARTVKRLAAKYASAAS